MSQSPGAVTRAFAEHAATFSGGGPMGPWLEALFEISGPGDAGVATFLTAHTNKLRVCLETGPVVRQPTPTHGMAGGALIARARVLADRVSPGQDLGVRHLVGALLAVDPTLPPLPASPSGGERTLRELGTAFLAGPPEQGDLPASWADSILGGVLARVPVPLDTGGTDRLDFARYAGALAAVMADRDVEPPLSIGLFGAWGSGKSFMIELMRERLLDISARADTVPESRFCRGIVPVDFNAWHYAETNLWASLFVRVLEVLGEHLSGTIGDATVQERGRVLAEIGQYTARLGAVEAEISTRRTKLKEERDKARVSEGLRTILFQLVGEAAPTEMSAALEEASKAAAGLRGEIAAARDTGRGVAGLWRRIEQLPPGTLMVRAGVGILAGAAIWKLAPHLVGPDIGHALGLLSTGLGTVALWLKTYRTWAAQQLRTLNAAMESEDSNGGLKKDADALRDAEDRAASLRAMLADLQARAEAQEPRRRLADFIAARTGSGDYEKLLGTPALIRRDLERLTAHLHAAGAAKGTEHPVERIVLIVDDLDRCGPEAVVKVLEAVHILLSSKLFVVIVGVDPRWLSGALAARFRGLLEPGGAGGRNAATPFEFIEKIFQVPFRVPEMSAGTRRDLAAASLPAPRVPSAMPAGDNTGQGTAVSTQTRTEDEPAVRLPPPRLPTVAPVVLEQPEYDLLLTLSAVAGDTPRRIKRFLRCYLILRASLNRDQRVVWYDGERYGHAARLLAAANGAPGVWPKVREALAATPPVTTAADLVSAAAAAGSLDAVCLETIFGTGSTPLPVDELTPWLEEVDRFTFPAWT